MVSLDVDVAEKFTDPLLSACEMTTKTNRMLYDDQDSYILRKPAKPTIPLRLEGELVYLDRWVIIPRKLTDQPFFLSGKQHRLRKPGYRKAAGGDVYRAARRFHHCRHSAQ